MDRYFYLRDESFNVYNRNHGYFFIHHHVHRLPLNRFTVFSIYYPIMYSRPSNMIDGHFIIDDVNVNRFSDHAQTMSRANRVPHPRHDRRRNLVNGGDRRHMLSEEMISKNLRKSQANSSQENSSCSICQEQILQNETIVMLDCGHDYHFDCIKQWLLIQNKCPNCRAVAIVMPF
ncbi:hypothetical protein ZOSMA_96G00690 [Zostera marina]|uniref:RING-type E3 ubiquitin transferase n=1 Tax=Zostera marina TaxID=29655 RepID=A0A0K9NIE2_ZOSMR|nr:hypothetical protein ZOSMA_96G00690 [Zostera marina]